MVKIIIVSFFSGFLGALVANRVDLLMFPKALASEQTAYRARRFELVDAKGKVRALLGFASADIPAFWIMDSKGTARVSMGLYEDETAYLGLQDKNGQMIQMMRSLGSSEAPLLIFKNRGQDKMILGLNSNLNPSFSSYQSDGKKKVHFGFSEGL